MRKDEIFDIYVKSVCDRYKVSATEQIFKKNKYKEVVEARFTLYYICYWRPMRVSSIQKFMGDNGYHISHSCILYGIAKMTDIIDKDEDYKKLILELESDAVHFI
tara:strand:+ start:202 stop:516 length:315 start_codon:yes stop_codon:yes gene_type:complete